MLALALGVAASPGVYAMLLGPGTSTAAGVPTGWGVVTDLIRKVGALQGEQEAREAEADPEGWWSRQGHAEPRYDTLLEALAPSVAARRTCCRAISSRPATRSGTAVSSCPRQRITLSPSLSGTGGSG